MAQGRLQHSSNTPRLPGTLERARAATGDRSHHPASRFNTPGGGRGQFSFSTAGNLCPQYVFDCPRTSKEQKHASSGTKPKISFMMNGAPIRNNEKLSQLL
uniref:Uncharacterized protein n=1 Tax=Heliothis virescens TaxID=7102 RepID=A0A2A4JXM5_HELVI